MRNKQDTKLGDEPSYQLQYFRLSLLVECGGRFVKNKQFGATVNSSRNGQPLSLSA